MSLQLVREWKFILCIGDSIGCCGYRGCRYYLRSRMGTALISLEFYALLLNIYWCASFDLLKASSGFVLFIVIVIFIVVILMFILTILDRDKVVYKKVEDVYHKKKKQMFSVRK